jgi:hypothetical protein
MAAANQGSAPIGVFMADPATGQALTGGDAISGPTAADAPLTSAPVTIGGRAATAPPTAVANADVVNAQFDKTGRQVVIGALREMKSRQVTTITSSTAETTIFTADATYNIDIYLLVITNTSATASIVTIKDATAGTTVWVFAVPAGQTVGFAVDSGSAVKQTTVNNNWTATCGTSVASIVITAHAVKNLA